MSDVENFTSALAAPNGVQSYIGLDQVDWNGNQCYEIWKVEPCCGSPWNPKDCLYCCALHYCCGLCVGTKALASSVDQDCALVPHCLCIYCCGPCASICLRHNVRKKNGVPSSIIGDCVCVCCCGACAGCQTLRGMRKEDWDFIPDIQGGKVGVKAPEMKIMA
eukprot:NODE_4306_length_831_cov_21.445013_g3978_i0.p2 GENE.NODE_4306_length_831_cov_21.445013_g3978_i0~~NODE_4306_length_831_cov_21.445013_g3978_i0.p2  ORF type:complete len:163 (+),score=22.17 NODE_4306_length_831_cov_21.445013_g3978_i0:106-594(+)